MLQEQLEGEMELHKLLESDLERNYIKPSGPSLIPPHCRELVADLANLEATVSELEQQLMSLHFRVSQERNERILTEYKVRHSSLQKSPTARCVKQSTHENYHLVEEASYKKKTDSELATEEMSSASSFFKVSGGPRCHSRATSVDSDTKPRQSPADIKLTRQMPSKGLWEQPNRLSEEMIRCMKNIFLSLADSAAPFKSSTSDIHFFPTSPHGHISSSSSRSSSTRFHPCSSRSEH